MQTTKVIAVLAAAAVVPAMVYTAYNIIITVKVFDNVKDIRDTVKDIRDTASKAMDTAREITGRRSGNTLFDINAYPAWTPGSQGCHIRYGDTFIVGSNTVDERILPALYLPSGEEFAQPDHAA